MGKNIGIITYHNTNNFGACLHSIALCEKMRSWGWNAEIIDYGCANILTRECPTLRIPRSIRELFKMLFYEPILHIKYKTLRKEMMRLTHISSKKYTLKNISMSNNQYDVFFVGSDVVWALDVSGRDYSYFLDFVKDDKIKMAFAASVGNCDLFRDDPLLPILLKRFQSIAVREQEAQEWVYDISGVNAKYVCDPTMLLTSKEWDELICPNEYESDYVLVYFSDNEGKCIRDAITYATENNLVVKFINYGRHVKGTQSIRPISLAQFIGYIKYAKMYFTASYHGLLFGLYYNKQLRYYNRARKSRMASLARLCNIEDYCGDMKDEIGANPINYDVVNQRISEFREYSEHVLLDMLNTIK